MRISDKGEGPGSAIRYLLVLRETSSAGIAGARCPTSTRARGTSSAKQPEDNPNLSLAFSTSLSQLARHSSAMFLIRDLDALETQGGSVAAGLVYSGRLVARTRTGGDRNFVASLASLIHRPDHGGRLESSLALASIASSTTLYQLSGSLPLFHLFSSPPHRFKLLPRFF